MKLFAKSPNGKMIKVGEDSATASFHFITEEVKKVIGDFNINDEVTVTIKNENGNKFITSIVKGSASPAPVLKPISSSPTTGSTMNSGNGFNKPAPINNPPINAPKAPYLPREEWEAKMKAEGKWNSDKPALSSDVNSSIKRQAIANATSRTIVGMNGTVTPENVIEVIEKIYNKYVELVG